MADRSVKLTLDAKVTGLVNGLKTGQRAVSDFGNRLETFQQKNAASLDRIGTDATRVGLVIGAGFAAAGKAAIDWESQWAGVMKTVDASPAQYEALEQGLRDLAKTLPATHEEIAGVAEAAGQLGVAREDVLGFTETMIDLGVSTNLTAEDAATSIAQISNVMGTMEREGSEGVERFGATLVELGNNGASTEADILNMAQRIAGAGATVGATESDVLALSNTLASMGVRAELGGGVATRVLLKMRTAVDEGGDSLQTFAETAGVSAEEFASKFRSSPMEALQLVAGGINNVNEAGGNVTATLKDMGIKGTEETQVMLALANSGDLLTESLKMGAAAWEENSALTEEAQKRYETAESKIKIAWNNIKDAAITAGEVMLPMIAGLADGVADLAQWFGSLPAPVQTALVLLGGITGVGAGVVGAFLKLAPEVRATRDALQALAPAGSKASGALKNVGKAAGFAAGLAAFAVIGGKIQSAGYMKDIPEGTGHIAEALAKVAQEAPGAAEALDSVFSGINGEGLSPSIKSMNDAIDVLFGDSGVQKAERWAQGIITPLTGIKGSVSIAEDAFGGIDQELANLVSSGSADAAADAMGLVESKLKESGVGAEEAARLFPMYADALARVEAESPAMAEAVAETVDPMQESADAAQDAADALDDYFDGLVATGQIAISESEAHIRLAESIRGAASALDENGKTLDINTEKGAANRRALNGIADATHGVMSSMQDSGRTAGEMAVEVQKGRDAFIQAATAAGMEADEAARLADEANLIPANVFTEYESNAAGEIQKITDLHAWIQSTPDKKITITDDSPVTKKALEDLGYIVTTLPDGRIEVSETGTTATGEKIDKTAGKKRTAKIDAEAITGAANSALDWLARSRTATIHTNYTSTGQRAAERANFGQSRQQHGGRVIRRYSNGGRLPATGLGTDKILGMDANGNPTAWVDDREWVINRRMSDKYHDELQAINNGTFPQLAGGGLVPAPSPSPRSAGPVGVQGGAQIAEQVSAAVSAAIAASFPSTLEAKFGPGAGRVLADLVNREVKNATSGRQSIYRK
ncbi:hypothetical protein GCM10022377_10250 [Zhihengliuella alba]|uniref:Phage tail tape measure protein domain-containing protein n=1 Tax=Zhihengliuella alba TaxID=547018 RepID=A0ABP7D4U6_9MICC